MPENETPVFTTIEVRRHVSKGRALHAQKAFAAGDIIQTFSPLLLHPSLSHIDAVCTYCLRPGTPRACSRCHCAWYCDVACQAAGWTAVHAKECKKLRTRRVGGRSAADLPTAVRLVLQALLKPEIADGIGGLEGHAAKRRAQADKMMDLRLMVMAACQMAGLEGEEALDRAIDVLCKACKTNLLGLMIC